MQDNWRYVQAILPASLTTQQVIDRVTSRIRLNASEAGEFVLRIHIDAGEAHPDGWRRWSAAYLPGPPGAFPPAEPVIVV